MSESSPSNESRGPSARSYLVEFNIVVLTIMAIVYHFPIMYVVFCGVVCLVLLPSYSRFTMDYASLCLLFSLLHGSFHDYFMDGMGICDNAFVDSHLHYGMLWCVYQYLPADQQEWFRSSRVIRGTLCANFLNCIFGMCLPALMNYKETGILDIKYSHACSDVNRLENWEYRLYGLTSLPSTIAIACYFVACTIVIRTKNGIHISKAILISTALFSGTTAAYFFVDPHWLVSFYNQIKYDQLYFIIPAFYVYVSKSNDMPSATVPKTNSRKLDVELDAEGDVELSIVESTNFESPSKSFLDGSGRLDSSGSGLSPGLSMLEGDPTYSFARYS